MSVEVLLIPIGITAVVALKEAYASDQNEGWKATRVVDADVLLDALPLIGATIMRSGAERIEANSSWGALTFKKVGATYLGRVDRAPEDVTDAMLAELDSRVGQVMQRRTAQLVVERAKALGFRLIEQRDEDGSLNYLFEEAT